MKKRVAIVSVLVFIFGFMIYLQYGREERVVNTVFDASETSYEQRFGVIVNKLFIGDKEQYTETLIEKAIQNQYQNSRFSYDVMGYPKEIEITVYKNVWNYNHGGKEFRILYVPKGKKGDLINAKDNSEMYTIKIDS